MIVKVNKDQVILLNDYACRTYPELCMSSGFTILKVLVSILGHLI